jgi:CBS domain-containing protein
MEEAARVMMRERIGALPIVDGKRVVGIVTRSDVLRAFVGLCERVDARERTEPAAVRSGLHATGASRRR